MLGPLRLGLLLASSAGSGCVYYYDLQLRPAELAARGFEVGASDEVCTARGRRFNLAYAHETEPAPASSEGFQTYRFGPGQPGSVLSKPPWFVMSLVVGGAGVAALIPPTLMCIADCDHFPTWAGAFAVAGGSLVLAGVSFLIVGLVDESAGAYPTPYEIIDMGKGAPCTE